MMMISHNVVPVCCCFAKKELVLEGRYDSSRSMRSTLEAPPFKVTEDKEIQARGSC